MSVDVAAVEGFYYGEGDRGRSSKVIHHFLPFVRRSLIRRCARSSTRPLVVGIPSRIAAKRRRCPRGSLANLAAQRLTRSIFRAPRRRGSDFEAGRIDVAFRLEYRASVGILESQLATRGDDGNPCFFSTPLFPLSMRDRLYRSVIWLRACGRYIVILIETGNRFTTTSATRP